MTDIYEPREDSNLLAEEVKKHAFGSVLDMGTGSGIQAETAASCEKVKSVVAADINPKAVAIVKKKDIKAIKSDLFSNFKNSEKFDTIIFNLPYLPDEPKAPDVALDGGKEGHELTVKFLSQIGNHLNPDGIVLILFSTMTNVKKVDEAVNKYCFRSEKLSKMKLSFEELIVYKLEWIDEIKPLLNLKQNITDIKRLTKGHRGLIFTANMKGLFRLFTKKITMKVQRKDVDAFGTVNNEILRLKKLNKYNIGPKVILSGNDHFAYRFIEGEFITPFFEKESTTKSTIVSVLKNVFDQMRTLDKLGLNKEEMHHPHKHILIGKGGKDVTLIDFERCKPSEKLHNVTQFCQFMMSGYLKPVFDRVGIKIDKNELMSAAKTYSNDMSDKNYKKILEFLR